MAHLTWKDVTVTFGNTAITGSVNQSSLQGVLDTLEDSGMGDDDKTYLPGMHGKTISLNGFLDSTVEGLIGPYVADRQTAVKVLAIDVGPKTYTGTVYYDNVQISGNVNALQTWSANAVCSGDLGRA